MLVSETGCGIIEPTREPGTSEEKRIDIFSGMRLSLVSRQQETCKSLEQNQQGVNAFPLLLGKCVNHYRVGLHALNSKGKSREPVDAAFDARQVQAFDNQDIVLQQLDMG